MIMIEPCAGLGNRLLALTSAYELSKKLNRELIIVWKREAGCNICSQDLFVFEGVQVVDISENGWKKEPIATLKSNLLKKKYRNRATRFVECDEVEAWKREGGYEKVERMIAAEPVIYVKSYTNLCEIGAKSFAFLTPAAAVTGRGRDTFARITDKTVGVHIRRTDHSDAIANSPLTLFIDRMKEEVEQNDASFYLTTDDASVIVEIRKHFQEERLIIYEDKVLDRDSMVGIQDALVDMLCLSKCCKIIGSYRSTFSLIPAIMGGIELEAMIKD